MIKLLVKKNIKLYLLLVVLIVVFTTNLLLINNNIEMSKLKNTFLNDLQKDFGNYYSIDAALWDFDEQGNSLIGDTESEEEISYKLINVAFKSYYHFYDSKDENIKAVPQIGLSIKIEDVIGLRGAPDVGAFDSINNRVPIANIGKDLNKIFKLVVYKGRGFDHRDFDTSNKSFILGSGYEGHIKLGDTIQINSNYVIPQKGEVIGFLNPNSVVINSIGLGKVVDSKFAIIFNDNLLDKELPPADFAMLFLIKDIESAKKTYSETVKEYGIKEGLDKERLAFSLSKRSLINQKQDSSKFTMVEEQKGQIGILIICMIFFLVVYHELIKNDIMFIELMRINGLSNNKILKNESIVIFALTIIGVFLSIVVDKFVFKVLYMNSLLKSLTIILILSLVVLLYFRNKIIESLRNMEK